MSKEVKLADLPVDDTDFYACEEGENFEALSPGLLAFGTTSRHVKASWLPAAFEKWGVKYKIVEGAADRGRPLSSGYFDPNALLIHHTGSTSSASKPAPSLGLVTNGRSDLAGPLCQVSTDYNGLTYIVAYGRANHAGKAKATMGNPAGDGNAMYLGNEVQTNGTQKMPDVQYQAVVLSSAAILDHFGYTDASKLGLHHTTSLSGKWDLGAGTGTAGVPYSITKLRADVTARLKAGPPNQEDDMPTIQEVQKAAADGVLLSTLGKSDVTVAVALQRIYNSIMAPDALADAVAARLEATSDVVGEGAPLDPQVIKDAVKSALREGAGPTA